VAHPISEECHETERTIIVPALITAFVALSPACVALADNPHSPANPTGPATGQPSQTEDPTTSPPGHSSGGFANTETHYANPDSTGGVHSGNSHVVSQYDVAGFQWALHHPAP
jgi:hypothetical protein